MPLYKEIPIPSGRMGRLWTLSTVEGACVLEFGCMGHMIYTEKWRGTVGCRRGADLYSTHLSEREIILGSTERLEKAIARLTETEKPEAIFLIPSSAGEITGMDYAAVAETLQECFPDTRLWISSKGAFNHTFSEGMEEALLQLVSAFAKPNDGQRENLFHILGCSAEWSGYLEDAGELSRIMKGALGLDLGCILPGKTSVKELGKLGKSRVNLVLRHEAVAAAKYLEERYGTTWVFGMPCGAEDTCSYLDEAAEAAGLKENREWVKREAERAKEAVRKARAYTEEKEVSVGGHSDRVRMLVRFLEKELGMKIRLCWVSDKKQPDFLFQTDEAMIGQLKKEPIFAEAKIVERAGFDPAFALTWNEKPHPFVGFEGAVFLGRLLRKEQL